MNKVKLWRLISILLVVSNLILLWFLVFHKPNGPRPGRQQHVIIKKLKFDKNQVEAYQKLIEGHRTIISKSDEQLTALKTQLYKTMQSVQTNADADSLIHEIAKIQMQVEQTHYNHFEDIKQLCKPDQVPAFDSLCVDLSNLFGKPKKRREKD
jgi:periplasmic protein CpxP/Spy